MKLIHVFYFLVISVLFMSCREGVLDDILDSIGGEDEPDEEPVSDVYILVQSVGGVRNATVGAPTDGDVEGDVTLINQQGDILKQWNIPEELGYDAELQPDGSLVASLRDPNTAWTFGNYGGIFRKINADNSVEWEASYSDENYIQHHDMEFLSNGNILFLAWERVNAEDAKKAGFARGHELYPETIVEMNPMTEEIVWKWNSMDHIVQDYDPDQHNYGVVADYSRKININYNDRSEQIISTPGVQADIMHANALTVDETNRLIYVSANFINEIWVIDYSTTTEEAATSEGGSRGLGGDLLDRFGNPTAYDNSAGEQMFHRQHYPKLLPSGNVFIYSNRVDIEQSEVVEVAISRPFSLMSGQDNEPTVVWSFTDPDLFSARASSGVQLENGNIVIGEGEQGRVWEVNKSGDVLWKSRVSDVLIWRAYAFEKDDPAIEALGL